MEFSSSNSVFEKVAWAVEQTVYVEGSSLSSASRLVDDLRLGRFGRIRLALYLEETFDVELPDETVDRFNTVGDIVRYVSRRCFESADYSGHAVAIACA